MCRRPHAVALALLLALAPACAPPSASDVDAGGTGDGGLGPDAAGATERSCATHFEYRPDGPVQGVELAGAWDWDAREPMAGPDASGAYSIDKTLAPGLWPYKLVVTDTGGGVQWIFDPGNPYRAYDGGIENSGMRVPDCTQPLLELESFERSPVRARLRFVRGNGGPAIDAVIATLRHDFDDTVLSEPAVQLDGARIDVELDGLPPGKYTLLVDAADRDGRAADTVRLPFWVEAESFDWRDAVIYMIMNDRFRNANPGNDAGSTAGADPGADWYGGDLAGVTAAIEEGYFDALGVRALWLSPVADNTDRVHPENGHGVTAFHGYWPVAARAVDPRLGTPQELEALVAAAHAHGIRVLLDFVINHVHEDHEHFAAHPDWFRTGCECGTAGCDWTEHRLDCLFHDYMPDVNWQQTDASEAFIADALWWLDRFDLDGFRVDAVKHVEDLAIANLSTRVHEGFELAGTEYFLLGETAMGWAGDDLEANREEYDTISRYIGPFGLNGQFDFVLYHATAYRVFATDERGLLHLDFWTRASLDNYPAYAVMTPYIGSHDTERFSSLAEAKGLDPTVHNKWADQGLPSQPASDEAYGRMRVAMAWLLTVPGAPLIYYGDEYGEYGGADPDNRHMWRPAAQRSAREQALFEWVQRLGVARRDQAALRRGDYATVYATETFLAYARYTGDEIALVVLNHSDAPATERLDPDPSLPPLPASVRDALDPAAPPIAVDGGGVTVTVPPRSAVVLVAE